MEPRRGWAVAGPTLQQRRQHFLGSLVCCALIPPASCNCTALLHCAVRPGLPRRCPAAGSRCGADAAPCCGFFLPHRTTTSLLRKKTSSSSGRCGPALGCCLLPAACCLLPRPLPTCAPRRRQGACTHAACHSTVGRWVLHAAPRRASRLRRGTRPARALRAEHANPPSCARPRCPRCCRRLMLSRSSCGAPRASPSIPSTMGRPLPRACRTTATCWPARSRCGFRECCAVLGLGWAPGGFLEWMGCGGTRAWRGAALEQTAACRAQLSAMRRGSAAHALPFTRAGAPGARHATAPAPRPRPAAAACLPPLRSGHCDAVRQPDGAPRDAPLWLGLPRPAR